nr:hypothetical protein [uncultured archaeon]
MVHLDVHRALDAPFMQYPYQEVLDEADDNFFAHRLPFGGEVK